MRTTLTIDADVAAMLRRIREADERSLKAVVNDALRRGLRQMVTPSASRVRYRTPPVDLERCLVGSLDDVAEVLAVAEDERFR